MLRAQAGILASRCLSAGSRRACSTNQQSSRGVGERGTSERTLTSHAMHLPPLGAHSNNPRAPVPSSVQCEWEPPPAVMLYNENVVGRTPRTCSTPHANCDREQLCIYSTQCFYLILLGHCSKLITLALLLVCL